MASTGDILEADKAGAIPATSPEMTAILMAIMTLSNETLSVIPSPDIFTRNIRNSKAKSARMAPNTQSTIASKRN